MVTYRRVNVPQPGMLNGPSTNLFEQADEAILEHISTTVVEVGNLVEKNGFSDSNTAAARGGLLRVR